VNVFLTMILTAHIYEYLSDESYSHSPWFASLYLTWKYVRCYFTWQLHISNIYFIINLQKPEFHLNKSRILLN